MDPLWADLINSDWRDYRGSGAREDRVANDEWLGPFLARTGWHEALPGLAGRERLRTLRALLRRIVYDLIQMNTVSEPDLAELNRALAGAPLVPRLERNGTGWTLSSPVELRAGMASVEASIAGSFAAMLAHGEPARIKICANPDCGWVMYDESRNRTRRWCDVKECGNLVKVRRFRARKKIR